MKYLFNYYLSLRPKVDIYMQRKRLQKTFCCT